MTETITLSAAVTWFLGACAALITLAKVWDIIKHWGKSDMKEEIRLINQKLDNDKKRIDSLEAANVVTMRALLALTRHSIDGNNIEGLKSTQKEIQDYLIGR